MAELGQAVVVGASIAGLFAARALSDFFERVIVIDRDTLDSGSRPRKAVPQGNHVHAILPPAYQSLQDLMPDVIETLLRDGAHLFDGGRDIKWWHLGRWLVRGETGQTFLGSTRPLFECRLRQCVQALGNVDIRPGVTFSGWKTDASQRVLGVYVEDADGQVDLSSDLAVDARGSASTLLRELVELGFGEVETERVKVDLSYTSCLFRSPDFSPGWSLLLMDPRAPKEWTGGVMERVESNQWIVTLWGYFGERAPADDTGFREFAESLNQPDIVEFLEQAQPVSDYRRYLVPECHLHHFDRLKHFPGRLIVMGDAVCTLNPIYGQGMTKAAKEGAFLRKSLTHLAAEADLSGLCDRFRRTMGNVGANWAWQLTTGSDLAYPQTVGKRPAGLNLINWYVGRLFASAETSLESRRALTDAMALVQPPESIMRPRLLLRALGM